MPGGGVPDGGAAVVRAAVVDERRGGPLSREVLGQVAEAGEDLLETTRHDPTSVADLDAPVDAPPPERAAPGAGRRPLQWPEATPDWARGPVGVLVTAAVTATVVMLLATGLAERRAAAERESELRVLATLTWPDSLPARGEAIDLQVLVLNAGPEPLTVTGLSLEDSSSRLRLLEDRDVGPGAAALVPASLQLDCGENRPDDLVLTATTADGRTRSVTPAGLGRRVAMTLDDLRVLCERQQLEPLPVWRTWVDPDGALVFQVRNPREEPAVLTVRTPPGTEVVGAPPLPATLPPGRTVPVRLYLDVVRCTNAAQRAAAGEQVEFRVDGDVAVLTPDVATVVGWFAQEVAEGCSG